jgi:serine/threonine kinase PknH
LLWEHLVVDPKDDPEARIRELERSLSDVAAKSELTASSPTTRTTRGRARVVLFVVVGLVALAAGVAVVVARHSGGSSSTSLTSSRPSTASTTTSPANQPLQRLFHLLPRAYNSNNCSATDSPNRQALATVQCGKTSDPDSPTYAAFSLYPDATALDKAFQDGISEDAVTPCPNGADSPGVWSTDGAPNVHAGAVLCGTYSKGPDLLWTQTKDLLLGDFQGPDLNALYRFWQDL